MKPALLLVLLLLAGGGGACGARIPSLSAGSSPLSIEEPEFPASVLEFQTTSTPGNGGRSTGLAPLQDLAAEAGLLGAAAARDGGGKRHAVHIYTSYYVRPSNQQNFVQRWQRYDDDTRDKGVVHNSLSKLSGDNIVFAGYIVYEDAEALHRHLKSDALRSFGEFIESENIAVSFRLLFLVDEHHLSAKATKTNADAEHSGKHGGYGSEHTRLLTTFIVPPGNREEFLSAWHRLMDRLSPSKGSVYVSLAKPADNNVVYLAYYDWSRREALMDFVHSKDACKFVARIEQAGVVSSTKLLWHVPSAAWRAA